MSFISKSNCFKSTLRFSKLRSIDLKKILTRDRSDHNTNDPLISDDDDPSDNSKFQFQFKPIRPLTNSNVLDILPPSKLKLRIISLSFNTPNIHSLLSQNFPKSKCFKYKSPTGHFSLTAIPSRYEKMSRLTRAHTNSNINSYGSDHQSNSLDNKPFDHQSCFSEIDQSDWIKSRKKRNRRFKTEEISLTFSLKIKDLHQSAVIRKSIRKRWVGAFRLIVQYGSYLTPAGFSSINQVEKLQKLKTREDDDGEDLIGLNPIESGVEVWLLRDHHYIVHPNLSINTVGLPELIKLIREALQSIKRQSISTPSNRMVEPF
ncbi:hypothetical protein BY996DRAFT_6722536 [Phakopsora pachyrhizi]|uniref:Expressed protein n=1 Tax=Phakopsora pachyrhizi TaxID=170000 RepID=A0AAV0BQX1_PHAPC|nr:hypothetical protein BY996DRAFT_6722536 [Phakopsora pachyrhizi]CAH7689772.1 expressed protein [Phakopsora pachyrhizi]